MALGSLDKLNTAGTNWISDTTAGWETNNNNNISGKPDDLNLSTVPSPSWGGDLRSRASPTIDTPPEGLTSEAKPEPKSPKFLRHHGHHHSSSSGQEGLWREDYCMSSQVKCRTALVIVALIALIHLILVIVLQAGATFDDVTPEPPVLDQPSHEQYSHQGVHVARQNNDAELLKRVPAKSSTSSNPMQHGCRSGHIQGFSPVCDIHGCLKRLDVEPAKRVSLPRHEPYDDDTRTEISFIPGRMHSLHMNIVTFLTDMQWHYNIYGSMGEVGCHLGKYAAVFAFNCHLEGGEKLFVSDTFSNALKGISNVPMTQFDVFHDIMKRHGFDFNSAEPSQKRIYLHDGPHSDLSKGLLVDWDLPQFRMFSVGTVQSGMEFFNVLETSTCLLRDGGILVVDGIHSHEKQEAVKSMVAKYIRVHGRSALTPLLSAQNKLYLCTTNWRDRFAKYMLEHRDILLALGIRGVTDSQYGAQFNYFQI